MANKSSKSKSLDWMHNYEILLEALKDFKRETIALMPKGRKAETVQFWVNDELVERLEKDYGRTLSKKQIHVAIHNLLRNKEITLVKRGKYSL